MSYDIPWYYTPPQGMAYWTMQTREFSYLNETDMNEYPSIGSEIHKKVSYGYFENFYFLPLDMMVTNGDGSTTTTTYEYEDREYNNGFLTANISNLAQTTVTNGSAILTQKNTYSQAGNQKYLTQIDVANGSNTFETKEKFEYDTEGNVVTKIDFMPGTLTAANYETYIYGYSNYFPAVKISGVNYTDIDPALIAALKDATNQPVNASSVNDILHAEKVLRAWLAMPIHYPNAMMTSYTYDPVKGVTSKTEPNGQTTVFEYDVFSRPTLTKVQDLTDNTFNIVSENTYHTRPN
jgi:YD repeat-containing protein